MNIQWKFQESSSQKQRIVSCCNTRSFQRVNSIQAVQKLFRGTCIAASHNVYCILHCTVWHSHKLEQCMCIWAVQKLFRGTCIAASHNVYCILHCTVWHSHKLEQCMCIIVYIYIYGIYVSKMYPKCSIHTNILYGHA